MPKVMVFPLTSRTVAQERRLLVWKKAGKAIPAAPKERHHEEPQELAGRPPRPGLRRHPGVHSGVADARAGPPIPRPAPAGRGARQLLGPAGRYPRSRGPRDPFQPRPEDAPGLHLQDRGAGRLRPRGHGRASGSGPGSQRRGLGALLPAGHGRRCPSGGSGEPGDPHRSLRLRPGPCRDRAARHAGQRHDPVQRQRGHRLPHGPGRPQEPAVGHSAGRADEPGRAAAHPGDLPHLAEPRRWAPDPGPRPQDPEAGEEPAPLCRAGRPADGGLRRPEVASGRDRVPTGAGGVQLRVGGGRGRDLYRGHGARLCPRHGRGGHRHLPLARDLGPDAPASGDTPPQREPFSLLGDSRAAPSRAC